MDLQDKCASIKTPKQICIEKSSQRKIKNPQIGRRDLKAIVLNFLW